MIKAILAHAGAGPKDQDKHAYGVDDVDRGDPDPKAKDRHAYGVDDVERLGLAPETRS